MDDLVPLHGVLGGLERFERFIFTLEITNIKHQVLVQNYLGSLQLLDDRAAGTDPDTLFPQEAVLAHRIWGVDEVLYSESTCMAFDWNHWLC